MSLNTRVSIRCLVEKDLLRWSMMDVGCFKGSIDVNAAFNREMFQTGFYKDGPLRKMITGEVAHIHCRVLLTVYK